MRKSLDIIAPLYNEATSVNELAKRVFSVADKQLKYLYVRLILIDDGSTDKTFIVAKELHEKNNNLVILKFSKNFGHHYAITAGVDYANADYCVIMDSDLQDEPENIPAMFNKLTKEKPLVYTVRNSKKGSIFKQFTSSYFWLWIRNASGLDIVKDQAMLRLFDKTVLKALKTYKITTPFYGGIFADLGFRYNVLGVEQAERFSGYSKYSINKLLNLFLVSTLGYGRVFKIAVKFLLLLLVFFSPIIVMFFPLELDAFLMCFSIYLLFVILLAVVFFVLKKKQSTNKTISYDIEVTLDKSEQKR